MWRTVVLALCFVYFAGLVVLAVALYHASPGPSDQAITGVGIGNYVDHDDRVYLSGRRLKCALEERDGRAGSRCTVVIAGETLEIRAWRNPPSHPNQLGGVCEARYAGKARSCWVGSSHVHVPFVAHIGESLGLGREQLRELRCAYFFEKLDEGPFVTATLIVPPLTALVVATAFLAAFWMRIGRRSLVAGRRS